MLVRIPTVIIDPVSNHSRHTDRIYDQITAKIKIAWIYLCKCNIVSMCKISFLFRSRDNINVYIVILINYYLFIVTTHPKYTLFWQLYYKAQNKIPIYTDRK